MHLMLIAAHTNFAYLQVLCPHNVGAAHTFLGTEHLKIEYDNSWCNSCRTVRVLSVCVCVRLSVFSPKQERRRKDEAVRATIMQKLIETGERERLKDLLRERLIQCGWRDELKVRTWYVIVGYRITCSVSIYRNLERRHIEISNVGISKYRTSIYRKIELHYIKLRYIETSNVFCPPPLASHVFF